MNTSPLLSPKVDPMQPPTQPIDTTIHPANSDPMNQANKPNTAMQFHDLQTFNHAVQLQQLACLAPVRSRLQDDEEPPKRKRGRPSKTEQEYLQKWYSDRGLDYQPPPKIVKNKPLDNDSDGSRKRTRKLEGDGIYPANMNIMTQQTSYGQGGSIINPGNRYVSSPSDAPSTTPQRHPRYGAIESYIDTLPDAAAITEFMTHIALYARQRVKHLAAPPPPPPAAPSTTTSDDDSRSHSDNHPHDNNHQPSSPLTMGTS